MIAGQCSLDCTATLMTEHHNQARTQGRNAVFDGAQRMVVNQVARRANDKKLTQVLVEDQLGRSARIGAGHNDGERVLRLGRLLATRCGRLAFGYLTRGKPEIALLE